MSEAAIKERPILFSGEMVRAILDGRKTQTRRVVKELPGGRGGPVGDHVKFWRKGNEDPGRWCGCDGLGSLGWVKCPFGVPGDRLWVRETWHANHTKEVVHYRADYGEHDPFREETCGEDHSLVGERWRPSIHMPRWASRITLEVTDVRVERLQEITNGEARAEGFPVDESGTWWRDRFHSGWDALNAKRGFGWDTNPWVWVVEFKRVEA